MLIICFSLLDQLLTMVISFSAESGDEETGLHANSHEAGGGGGGGGGGVGRRDGDGGGGSRAAVPRSLLPSRFAVGRVNIGSCEEEEEEFT